MNKTALNSAKSMHNLKITRTAARAALQKRDYTAEEINTALIEVYGEVKKSRADWSQRVQKMRQLVKESKYTQKEMADILVSEKAFGGKASARQCMPYIAMAQEWVKQELKELNAGN